MALETLTQNVIYMWVTRWVLPSIVVQCIISYLLLLWHILKCELRNDIFYFKVVVYFPWCNSSKNIFYCKCPSAFVHREIYEKRLSTPEWCWSRNDDQREEDASDTTWSTCLPVCYCSCKRKYLIWACAFESFESKKRHECRMAKLSFDDLERYSYAFSEKWQRVPVKMAAITNLLLPVSNTTVSNTGVTKG